MMHMVVTVLEVFNSRPTYYILCVNIDLLLSEMWRCATARVPEIQRGPTDHIFWSTPEYLGQGIWY